MVEQTHQGRELKRKGLNWVFSPHLLPLPLPATEPHTPPLPPKPGLCSFLGTVVSKPVLINRQARGGLVAQTTDPRTSSRSWQWPGWAQASSLAEPVFSLEINSFLACLRLSSSLRLTEHPKIWS